MVSFSANLGFLFTDRPLPDAIEAAARAGFDAVECHWPYETDAQDIRRALQKTGLPMLGINTLRGDVEKGENGLCALPGREREARESIDQAIDFARAIGAQAVHVMAGAASGREAEAVFFDNLGYAAAKAASHDLTLLLESLNRRDAPGYFLNCSRQAADLIARLERPEVKLMFDCYHIQIIEGDLFRRLVALMPIIGHIQFAGVPDRGEPDQGEVHYVNLLRHAVQLGYDKPFGAEYRPASDTEAGLGWLSDYRAALRQ